MIARLPITALFSAGLLLVVSACSDSNSSSVPPPVVASATIGPAGGAVVVDAGRQAGIVLTIPAGALDDTTEIRVIDEVNEIVGVSPTSIAPLPGFPFRIEPVDVVLNVAATLTVPYQPVNVSFSGVGTAPGNVRVMQENPWTIREIEPGNVDVAEAEVSIESLTFGSFQVIAGPSAMSLLEYMPPRSEVVNLGGGYQFVVEPVSPTSPFAADDGELWRITGPGIDESLIFVDGRIVGRRADPNAWREAWLQQHAPFHSAAPYGSNVTIEQTQFVADFEAPVGSPPLGSAVSLWSVTRFIEPRTFDGRQVRDLILVLVGIDYQHPAVAPGERWLRFYLSRADGLVGLEIDGVEFERVP